MTAEDLFGMIVRLAGLTLIIFCLFDLFHVIATLTGLPAAARYSAAADSLAAAFYGVSGLIISFWQQTGSLGLRIASAEIQTETYLRGHEKAPP